MKDPTKVISSAVLACALVMAMSVPAHASEEPSDVLNALQDVTDTSSVEAEDTTDVLSNVAAVETTAAGDLAIDDVVGGAEIAIPTDPSNDLSLSNDQAGFDISVGLPFADEAQPAVVEAEGIVSYDNGNGSATVPVVKDDGSVQVTTIIDNAQAPTRYDYEIALGEGGYLEEVEGGLIVIRDAAGTFQGGVLPAWAQDANGDAVATHFEIEGGRLTQVVEHTDADAYPIVADPAVGGLLIAGYWKNRAGGYKYKNGSQWSTRLSGWGLALWTSGLAGHVIVRDAGWIQWKNLPTTPINATIEQQYKCHATYGYAVWLAGVWWDFETARGTNYNWFLNPQKCNWA